MTRFSRILLAALAVCVLQTGILGYIIGSRAAILRSGTEILLKTAPVDPRDLLRGDYVVLNYEASIVPASAIVGPQPKEAEKAVLWVRLAKGADEFWTVREASFERLEPTDGNVVLKTLPFQFYPPYSDSGLQVQYGIERFYVPEGEGKALEEARNEQALTIAARVSSSGKAQIRSLLMDGKPVYDEPLY